MRLSFCAVTESDQFKELLIVRNECREGLTHDRHEITLSEQKQFINLCWPQQGARLLWYEPYLLYDDKWPIGYGLLKWDGEKYWMTIGLVKQYRGIGLSRLLIHYITEMGHRQGAEVWLDVSKDNVHAYNGYLKAGYEIVTEDSSKHDTLLTVMKHARK